MNDLVLSEHYAHHPYYVEMIQSTLSSALLKQYGIVLSSPELQRKGRSLRNFFRGEKRRVAAGSGIEIQATQRQEHDNYIFLRLDPQRHPKLVDRIRESNVKTLADFLVCLGLKRSN